MSRVRFFSIIKSSELLADLKLKKTLVIDVREPDMFAKGHVPGAVNFDSKSILVMKNSKELLEGLPLTDSITIHCQLSLIRGPTCANHLEHLIKKNGKKITVRLLDGGFKGWQSANYPFETL